MSESDIAALIVFTPIIIVLYSGAAWLVVKMWRNWL